MITATRPDDMEESPLIKARNRKELARLCYLAAVQEFEDWPDRANQAKMMALQMAYEDALNEYTAELEASSDIPF